MFWPRFKPCDCFDSWDKNLGSGNTLLGENPTMAQHPIRDTGRGRILQDASCLVLCYRNRVKLRSSGPLLGSCAPNYPYTWIRNLLEFVCSQTERLTHHQQKRKKRNVNRCTWKCTAYPPCSFSQQYDYSSCVVSNALLIFETSIAWPLTWVNKSHASSCSTGFFHL